MLELHVSSSLLTVDIDKPALIPAFIDSHKGTYSQKCSFYNVRLPN